MDNKQLLEMVVELGGAETYRRLGATQVLEILSEQKKVDRQQFTGLSDQMFFPKMLAGIGLHKALAANEGYALQSPKTENLCGVIFEYPIAFCRFQMPDRQVFRNDIGKSGGVPLHFSCTLLGAPNAEPRNLHFMNTGTEASRDELKLTALKTLLRCHTTMVWGEEQVKYCELLLKNRMEVRDMQWYTYGFYKKAISERKLLAGKIPLELWEHDLIHFDPPKVVQPLYWDLHEESLLDYLYAEFIYAKGDARKAIGDKLAAYWQQDTIAMLEVFNAWKDLCTNGFGFGKDGN